VHTALAESSRTLQHAGWTEYVLPDSSLYFVHPGMHITTDVDLRDPKKLDAITAFLDNDLTSHSSFVPKGGDGWEMWLRDGPVSKRQSKILRTWVNHRMRAVFADPPARNLDGVSEDDSEYLVVRLRCPTTDGDAIQSLTWSIGIGRSWKVIRRTPHYRQPPALKLLMS
jgi:hypothetical protein